MKLPAAEGRQWIWKSIFLATSVICSLILLEMSRNLVETARIYHWLIQGECG